ncbi:hypothetical protein TMatcc_005145 [Talaromyces marneffei ATCC 18224]|uniref:C6 transcription factor, putative n=2 Tax=Talaromyces marneffei TaxID=37727 RepID=B6QCC3_TALMQ|nr:C6 transcription factor, putative [Talaromyces marneffei ATCC 18224]EEA26579.1 C6 transcription factor, putative [Talaromyces marneffei ATCC 18224]
MRCSRWISDMPRPKVRPEDRQRSSKACLPCQASKIRCDAQTPCISCVRRDRSSTCTYGESHRRRLPRARRTGEVRFASFTSSADGPPASLRARTLNESTNRCPEGNGGIQLPISISEAPSVQSPECTESRLLLSSKGEKVYIGETSSLSFLQFLRGIMKQYMGPSSFTENGPVNVMLEAETSVNRNITFEESLTTKEELIQTYFEVTSGFFDLFDKDDILKLLQIEASSSGRRINREEMAVLYLVIAIGGQCRGSHISDFQYATKYFSMGQQYAFEGMLRDPSINMLRVFLLMAFYMLGACHRNAAYMYLGVASKAAAALGLHIGAQARGLSTDEAKTRWRTYKSLRVFDLVVSFLLGRPASSVPSNHDDMTRREDLDPQSIAVLAAYNGSILMEEIFKHLKRVNSGFDVPTAEAFLRRLRQWINGLPRNFRQISFDGELETLSVSRETAVGNIHVSCIYYFAVILTTRSFLISHLMSRLKESSIVASNPTSPTASGTTEQQRTSPQLAHVCIGAATYMANMCEKAMLSGLLLRNMCIMKAWVFAAGLILGFSLFAYDDIESRNETESAFQSARYVLQNLANLSPQARQYDEILTSFAEAIVKHRQQTLSARQKIADRYIDCVLDIGVATSMEPQPHRQGRSTDGGGYSGTWEELQADTQMSRSSISGIGVEDRCMHRVDGSDSDIAADVDLDGFNVLPFDDGASFSIDYEPFGLLLDGI